MADLLDRQAVVDLFETYHPCMATSVIEFGNALKGLPTVEAEPVRHGRWIHGREVCREYIGITLVSVQYEHWKCSACGYQTEGEPLWKYCPNCGAKMDERKEE